MSFFDDLKRTLGIPGSKPTPRSGVGALVGQALRESQALADSSREVRTEHQRGSELRDMTSPTAQAKVAAIPGDSPNPIRVGGVPVPMENEQQHMILIGAPGSGKSVAIKRVLSTIRERGQKALVFDPAGEFTAMFHRPGHDLVFNPLDERHLDWSLWTDTNREDWAGMAETVLPDTTQGENKFFIDSARIVLRALFRTCSNLDEVLVAALSEPDDVLRARVEQVGMAGLLGPAKTFQSTRATLGAAAEGLAVLPSAEDDGFSIRSWIEDNDDDRWIFMPVRKNQQKSTRLVMTLFINRMIELALSSQQDKARRIWMVLDELRSLGKMPALEEGLAEGRKFGLTGVLGLQATGQIKAIYGKDAGAALLSMPKTRLIFRVSDAESAEDASRELGERQIVRRKTSRNQGTSTSSNTNNDGIKASSSSNTSTSSGESHSVEHAQERIVLPAEIAGLPDLTAFLRMGTTAVYRVPITWKGLPESAQPGSMPVPQRIPPWEMVLDQPGAQETPDATAKEAGDNPEG